MVKYNMSHASTYTFRFVNALSPLLFNRALRLFARCAALLNFGERCADVAGCARAEAAASAPSCFLGFVRITGWMRTWLLS